MNTLRLTADADDIERAAALLRQGELVAMPTETVYGLAADASDDRAVRRIFAAKGRPADNPLIVHIASEDQLRGLAADIPITAKKLATAFWPGPLTMIFRRQPSVPQAVCAGLDTVAVRMPSHPTARALISRSMPLAAPSANLSGSPSPTTAAHVLRDLDGRIAAIIDGGECTVGVESTVLDVSGPMPILLRPGGITAEMLRETVGNILIDPAVTAPLAIGQKARSPGMKYRHYAPKASVTLVRGGDFAEFVNRQPAPVTALCFDEQAAALRIPYISYGSQSDPAEQARRLFDALRALDEAGAVKVFAACPDPGGIGLAVYNRLLRAAGFEVINLE